MKQIDINSFAKKNGYERAEYLNEWNGFSCYEAIFDKDDVACVGLPLLILIDDKDNIRLSTPDEAMRHVDETAERQ